MVPTICKKVMQDLLLCALFAFESLSLVLGSMWLRDIEGFLPSMIGLVSIKKPGGRQAD
jgi:hypothetical protein